MDWPLRLCLVTVNSATKKVILVKVHLLRAYPSAMTHPSFIRLDDICSRIRGLQMHIYRSYTETHTKISVCRIIKQVLQYTHSTYVQKQSHPQLGLDAASLPGLYADLGKTPTKHWESFHPPCFRKFGCFGGVEWIKTRFPQCPRFLKQLEMPGKTKGWDGKKSICDQPTDQSGGRIQNIYTTMLNK